ncbi:MAG: winged helix-turn-helix transcriptional regulator [Arenicellales bacterium]
MNGANEKEDKLTLELLNAIDQRSDLSQRHLARQMGIALGLTNSYLKRCARKGLVKVSEAPANRFLYYLTPKGFAEKARLTGVYLSNSLIFYRKAGESCTALFELCSKNKNNRILLCGVSELTEIALIRAMDAEIRIAGVYDPESSLDQLFSTPVWANLSEAKTFDMCLLTDLNSPYEFYESLVSEVGKDRVLIPDVLGITDKSKKVR